MYMIHRNYDRAAFWNDIVSQSHFLIRRSSQSGMNKLYHMYSETPLNQTSSIPKSHLYRIWSVFQNDIYFYITYPFKSETP